MVSGCSGGSQTRHGVLFSSAVSGAYLPIAIHCPSLGPFPSISGGAPRPLTTLCPPSPSLAYLSLSTSLSLEGTGTLHQLVGIRLLAHSVNPTFPTAKAKAEGGGSWLSLFTVLTSCGAALVESW